MTGLSRRLGIALFLIGSVLFSACSGSREAVRDDGADTDEPAAEVVLSDVEDFDPEGYRDEPPVVKVDVDHDVPEELMQSRVGAGTRTRAQGFRVQVLSTQVKSEADALYERALNWWRAVRTDYDPDSLPEFGSDLPIYIIYRQPYYRVRIGDFDSRGDAEEAQRFLAQRFQGAFIVPDAIAVQR